MPKLGTYGSVRGALSNGCLYRDCGNVNCFCFPLCKGGPRGIYGPSHTLVRAYFMTPQIPPSLPLQREELKTTSV